MINSSDYSIAIDIGNTRTHIGIIRKSNFACLHNETFFTSQIHCKILPSIESILRKSGSPQISGIVIASVVKNTVSRIQPVIENHFGPVTCLKYSNKLPLAIHYKNPETLGADRIADALYCCFAYPKNDVLIIDAGTAIKVDVILSSQFIGGTIIPGIESQFHSLHNSTSALPLIKLPDYSVSLPGTSTDECMIGGILYGTAGAINNLVEIYKNKYSQNMVILTTGGTWRFLNKLVNFENENIPEMTLIGTSLYNYH